MIAERRDLMLVVLLSASLISFLLCSSSVAAKAPLSDGFAPESHRAAPAPKWAGVLSKNKALSESVLIGQGILCGPEDVAVDGAGTIYASCACTGKIYRIRLTTQGDQLIDVFANPGGATLGLCFNKNNELIACNCPRGLLAVKADGNVRVLTDHVGTQAIGFADDLDIAQTGEIYFSDASAKYGAIKGKNRLEFDFLEGRAHGSLYVYDPATKLTRLLLQGLYFANGVALSKDEDYVLVNESARCRVRRYWLKGPKAGTDDIFLDNLPGFPDGITRDPQGGFWIAVPNLRSRYVDYMQHSLPAKHIAYHLPVFVWRQVRRYGLVLKVNELGEITESLHDPTGKVFSITNVVPWHNYLYLGSLDGKAIARYDRSKQRGH